MHKLLQEYKEIIADYEIETYEIEGNNIRLKLRVTFIDQSSLFMRDYIFEGERRKYSFHWQDSTGNLLIRWDNAPHWPEIDTHPHHKHIGAVDQVEPSEQTELREVLEEIVRKIKVR